MRWPWTRTQQDKHDDERRAEHVDRSLDAVVHRANRVLDKADRILRDADKRLRSKPTGSQG